MDIEVTTDPNVSPREDIPRVQHFKNADRVRIQVGTTVYSFQQDNSGLMLTKVDMIDPLNEPVIITPVHTNKIRLS